MFTRWITTKIWMKKMWVLPLVHKAVWIWALVPSSMGFQPETSFSVLPWTPGHRNQSLTASPGDRMTQAERNEKKTQWYRKVRLFFTESTQHWLFHIAFVYVKLKNNNSVLPLYSYILLPIKLICLLIGQMKQSEKIRKSFAGIWVPWIIPCRCLFCLTDHNNLEEAPHFHCRGLPGLACSWRVGETTAHKAIKPQTLFSCQQQDWGLHICSP